MNLRGVDLNLLTVFEVVYEEGNQQRAAERLAMTQPAISSSMSRLKTVVDDDLFVPGPRGVTPTPAADRLYSTVHSALSLVREGIGGEQVFDPATAKRTFRIASTYAAALGNVGPILSWLASEAPGIRLVIETVGETGDLPKRMRTGALDFLIDYALYDDPDIEHVVAVTHRLVAIARRVHPTIRGRLTMKQYNTVGHVTHREPHEPGQIARLDEAFSGVTDEFHIEVSNALAMPLIIAQTDLIAVTTESIARFFENLIDLQVLELPFPVPPIPIHIIWHRSRTRDAGHRWLREGLGRFLTTRDS